MTELPKPLDGGGQPFLTPGAQHQRSASLRQPLRHFFPELNDWLDRLPDRRDPQACTYPTRFLAWWGILLYLLQLSSRRQLDFQLNSDGPEVLPNLNRLAQTNLASRPVHDTLDYFIGRVAIRGWVQLRYQFVQRLVRMKALDAARLLGQIIPVLLKDHIPDVAALERQTAAGGS